MSTASDLFGLMAQVPDRTIYQSIQHYENFDSLLAQMHEDGGLFNKREVIKDHINARWDEIASDIEKEAVGDENGRLFIHRCITVRDPGRFIDLVSKGKFPRGYQGLGVYWTWNFRSAECHWGNFGRDSKKIIMTGTVSLSDIDVAETVLANFHPDTGRDENEIRLSPGVRVRLTDISRGQEWPVHNFNPEVEIPA